MLLVCVLFQMQYSNLVTKSTANSTTWTEFLT